MKVKRILDCYRSDFEAMDKEALLQSIRACEGRTILAEADVSRGPADPRITNPEVARAGGADLVLLNKLDLLDPYITGYDHNGEPQAIPLLKEYLGVPMGVNLEPMSEAVDLMEPQLLISSGRHCTPDTLQAANHYGFDFICLTGNPQTGVGNQAIIEAIRLAKEHYQGIIIAGKMHSSGVNEAVCDPETVASFLDAGADIILIPAVGTVPGFTRDLFLECIQLIRQRGALSLAANGTSQDWSQPQVIQQLALLTKELGADIHHIGSSGYGGVAPITNIMELSIAIRGMNHTIHQMAKSNRR